MARQGGFGIVLKVNTGSLTAITYVAEVDFPEQEKFLADATSHDSSGGYVEYIATGLRALNPFEATLNWDDTQATHAALLTNLGAESSVGFSIQDPDGQEVIAFNGHVTKIKRIGKMKEMFQATVTIQPTGAPTIT